MTRFSSRSASVRRGMSLVEMLVATTATLILMGAIAQVFSVFGSAVTNSRSMIEQDARMRSVAWRLRTDLTGATARMLPPLDPTAGEGYFEVIEGPRSDGYDSTGTLLGPSDVVGDTDDLLLFTTRSSDTPFLGKAGSSMIESSTAEVAWFLEATNPPTTPPTYTLFRRQLLVVGYVGGGPFASNNTAAFSGWGSSWDNFFDQYDMSVRLEGAVLVPNTLSDLTRRESRFLHNPTGITNGSGFPYPFISGSPGQVLTSPRIGEDIVLTNVIAFDVRVFDSTAPVEVSGSDAGVPGDPGYMGGAVANGCYVDLGIASTVVTATTPGPSGVAPHFVGTGTGPGLLNRRTYDTWSVHYESNGVDEDGIYGPDQGTDGLDNDGDGSVDEDDEQETSPPYPYPLRGIEVRIRCFEPSSRQVRQVTVRHTFVPH